MQLIFRHIIPSRLFCEDCSHKCKYHYFISGSIPATGRKGAGNCQNGIAVSGQFLSNAGGTSASGRSSTPTTPMSAPNSLQFNHLIGGAMSPNLVQAQSVQQQQVQQHGQGQQVITQTPANAHIQLLTHQQQPTAQILASNQQMNQNLMIGDYVQGNLNNVVLQNTYRQ